MNETTFRKNFAEVAPDDDENFDKYATQFTHSLENLPPGEEPPIYWHGRLIGYASDDDGANVYPYVIRFLGEVFDETTFREKLKSNDILIKEFTPESKPTYDVDAGAPSDCVDPRVVSYHARLVVVHNGSEEVLSVKVVQHIRRTYVAYKTEIT